MDGEQTVINLDQLAVPPDAGDITIVSDGNFSADALARLLGSDPSNVQQWQDEITVDAQTAQNLLGKNQTDVLQALMDGRSAVIDLDRLDEHAVSPEVLSRGLESYALYDNNDKFVKLVFVPWNANADSVISAIASGLAEGWRRVRVFFKADDKIILGLGEKIHLALNQAKEWACSIEPRPDEVSVAVESQFDLQVVSFGGSTGVTYSTTKLCGDG